MIVPVRCDRCRQTAEEAGTEIDEGLCRSCAFEEAVDHLRDEWQREQDYLEALGAQFEPAGVGYTEDF